MKYLLEIDNTNKIIPDYYSTDDYAKALALFEERASVMGIYNFNNDSVINKNNLSVKLYELVDSDEGQEQEKHLLIKKYCNLDQAKYYARLYAQRGLNNYGWENDIPLDKKLEKLESELAAALMYDIDNTIEARYNLKNYIDNRFGDNVYGI